MPSLHHHRARPPRVVHLLQSFATGGLERMVLDLATGLVERGVNSTAVAYLENGPVAEALVGGGVPATFLASEGGLDFSVASKLVRVLREQRATHVHTHHLGPFLYGAVAARRAGVKHVHTEHSHELYDAPRRRLLGHLMRSQATLVACGEEVAAFHREHLRGVDAVIPNGVRVPARDQLEEGARQGARGLLGLPHDAEVVVTVCRLAPEKRVDRLLEVFARLRARRPRARLVIVGDGPQRGRLQGMVDAGSGVTFLGLRPDPDLALRAADVFTLTSDREGLPLAVLEALAHGRPFVGTPVGDLPLLAEAGGGLVANDVDDLAHALGRLLDDRALRQQLGHCGRRLVIERYGRASMVDRYLDLYLDSPTKRAA